jgi:thiamine biosynthesis lipoprotein
VTSLRTATVSGEALGTTTRLVTSPPDALPGATRLAARWLPRLERAASRFRPDSELSLANAAAGRPVRVGPVLRDALTAALGMAAATDGLVDPTVGSLLSAAGYDRTFTQVRDGVGRLKAPAADRPTWRDVRLQGDAHGALLTVPPGCALDLGAIGKAWLADLLAAEVSAAWEAGSAGALVDLGGDISVAGPPPRHGWLVALPPGADGQRMVSIVAGGIATSAQHARAWQTPDGPAHHIMDPRSGLPARSPWQVVTVHAATAVEANAASTAAMVLGADAPAWLQAHQLAARLVPLDGSPALRVGAWPRLGSVPDEVRT